MKRLLTLLLLVCLGVGCGSSHACVGREIVLRAVPQHGEALTPAGMQVARTIVASRLGSLGVASPSVEIRGGDEIVVSGPVPETLGSLASSRGHVQFFDFEKDLAPPTVKNGNPTPYPTADSLALPEVPVNTTELVAGTRANFTASARPVKRSPNGAYWYLFKLPPALTGKDIRESTIAAGTDPNTGQPEVTFGFTRHGAKEFQAITKAEYDRGRLVAGLHGSAGKLNPLYAQHNAIVVYGEHEATLEATPYIDYTDAALSLGIAGAQGVIPNLRSIEAAKRLALLLQTASLPYRFEQVSSKLCRS